MENVVQSIDFFLPKILIGSLIGAILSSLGVILVLRNMSFFCITISQVVTSIYAVTLFLGLSGESTVILLTLFITLPIFIFLADNNKIDTILGILFVSFGAFSHMLLAIGGNIKNHLLSAYLGDILLSELSYSSPVLYVIIFLFSLFIFIYKKILFLSFDRDEYNVSGRGSWVEWFFFTILIITLTISVKLLGSIYSSSLLLIPGFTSILLFKSMRQVFIFSILMSIVGGTTGFIISLVGITNGTEIIYFPTSSTIVCVLTGISLLILSGNYIYRIFISKGRKINLPYSTSRGE